METDGHATDGRATDGCATDGCAIRGCVQADVFFLFICFFFNIYVVFFSVDLNFFFIYMLCSYSQKYVIFFVSDLYVERRTNIPAQSKMLFFFYLYFFTQTYLCFFFDLNFFFIYMSCSYWQNYVIFFCFESLCWKSKKYFRPVQAGVFFCYLYFSLFRQIYFFVCWYYFFKIYIYIYVFIFTKLCYFFFRISMLKGEQIFPPSPSCCSFCLSLIIFFLYKHICFFCWS